MKRKMLDFLKYVGPAFLVSVAYIDPGNFATNICGGSKYNYSLLWVILISNAMAIYLQIISAKLGIVTGENLPQMCRKTYTKRTNFIFWCVAELAAMATTLAEFLGAALGLYLLFGIPLFYAGIITAIITYYIMSMQKYGHRVIEFVIISLIAVICVAYGIEIFLAKPIWGEVLLGTITPKIKNADALLIAVGMLGATVMPHVIFLHSQLVQPRNNEEINDKKKHLKLEKIEIIFAMNIAFFVNAAMVVVSAAVFYSQGLIVETIEQAHLSLTPLVGELSSGAFGIALLASGLSSSVIGAMAGETIMDGFCDIKLSLTTRRIITMLPAVIIIAIGLSPIKVLLISQVFLSFALPFAIIPLMQITGKKDIMGQFTNKTLTKIIGWVIVTLIILLNLLLVVASIMC